MPHPTPTVPIAASPPLHEKGPRGFPLATLVARIMLAVFLFFTMMTVVPWFLTRGPDVAFGVLVSALPTLLILAAFALLLPRGNRIVAAVFGLWCVWGLVGSFSGGPNLLPRRSDMPLAS